MKIGFFLALREDVQHFLHGASLVREARKHMPEADIVQLSDMKTPAVPGVTTVERLDLGNVPLLHLRLKHYSRCTGDCLLVDTDVSIRNSVAGVFDDQHFDVALCDRQWPHLPQSEQALQTMPFNTGVVFCRNPYFWLDVLNAWLKLPTSQQDWMSEQRMVYQVVRTGQYFVKILPGMPYNYPPHAEADIPIIAACVHYKGPRKSMLSTHAYEVLGR